MRLGCFGVVILSFALALALAACGPSRPEATSLRACDDTFFFGNHVSVWGTVPATSECARLTIVHLGDDHLSKVMDLPPGWDVGSAILTSGSCDQPSGDPRPAGSLKGFVRLHEQLLSTAHNVELDVELARGALADPPSVFLSGSVDAESDFCDLSK